MTRAAVRFYADRILGKELKRYVHTIRIEFNEFYDDNETDIAWCEYREPRNGGRPRTFVIAFNSKYLDIRVRDYLMTLFHELTHLKQYISQDLQGVNPDVVKWKGKPVKVGSINYWLEPWEIEARGMEQACYTLFTEAHPEFRLKRFTPRYNGRSNSSWKG